MSLCKDYNPKPIEADELKEYEVSIYSLIKEKESFEMWWIYKKK